MTVTTTDGVAALLDELDRYPDERAAIIFELAAEFDHTGRPAEALEWLETLAHGGGVDGALARVEMAGLHYAAGRTDEADAQLTLLKRSRQPDPVPYASAGELLAELGDDAAAVRWFTMAALRLTGAERAAAYRESGWATWGYSVLWQRRKARARLGLPPDEMDDGLVEPPLQRRSSFPSLEEARSDGLAAAAQIARILVWPQEEFGLAGRLWPALLAPEVDFTEYRTRTERHMRETAAGGTRVQLVEARVAALRDYAGRTGGSVMDTETRYGYLQERAGLGNVADWPPGRNAPCWCGSGVKYKKCCGRPGS